MLDEESTFEVLKGILGPLRAVKRLLKCLDADELRRHRESIVCILMPILMEKVGKLRQWDTSDRIGKTIENTLRSAEVVEELDKAITEVAAAARAAYKRERDVRPRNTIRDAEIVRLRDEKGLTFGQIPKQLAKINATWVGKDGKPLKRDTVEKAYDRMKQRSDR